MQLNPGRLGQLVAEDHMFRFMLHKAPVASAIPDHHRVSTHAVRILYPSYFPAAPLEVYMDRAFLHPNVHPLTGFVCVWDQHRVSNTIEHAIHKLVAMMSGHLYNRDPLHVMQPNAWHDTHERFAIEPLRGLVHDREVGQRYEASLNQNRRTRLS